MERILITGALGQIGSELVPALRARYGAEAVVASDVRMPSERELGPSGVGPWADGPFEQLDAMHRERIDQVVSRYRIDTIYHLAALLSATAEERPQVAWEINMGSLFQVLEVARGRGCSVFVPSSIGAFGPGTPKDPTPQDTIQRPNTIYGVTKVAGELLCDYYHHRFGVDTRGVRYPGIVSHGAPPGGGTTDYAVEIFHHALAYGSYRCFLRRDTRLDMMYMPDAVRAAIEVMEADPTRLEHRNAFNVGAMSFTPEELATSIRRRVSLEVEYEPDPVRQRIADSWPDRLNDSAARTEWGWSPRYDLDAMVDDMIDHLAPRLGSDGVPRA